LFETFNVIKAEIVYFAGNKKSSPQGGGDFKIFV
jgi:hypothetical protein